MAGEIQTAHLTGKNVYALVRNATGGVWNGAAFVSYVSGNLASYAIAMAEQGTASGYYVGTCPVVAAGIYGIAAFERGGGSPAEGDLLIASGDLHWDGAAVIPRLPPGLAELSAVPPAAPTIAQALMFLYMALRNGMTVTAAQQKITNDAGSTIGTSSLTDDGVTFSRGKFS
jgi:hypothetical protein